MKSFQSALLLEDEIELARTLKVSLEQSVEQVTHFTTLKESKNFILNSPQKLPELMVLDRNVPDGDGLTLCQWLREQNYSGSILILTASGQTEEKVKGLDAGADDYLPKPFSWPELKARIKALSRRKSTYDATLSNHWKCDEDRMSVFSSKTGWVVLTQLEFKLASLFVRSQGKLLTRDELLKKVWGFHLIPKTRTVDHFMGRLRKYFEEDIEKPKHFVTVRGAGYRFIP